MKTHLPNLRIHSSRRATYAFAFSLGVSLAAFGAPLFAAPTLESFRDDLLTEDLDGLLEGLPEGLPGAPRAMESNPNQPRGGADRGEDLGQSPIGKIKQGMNQAQRLLLAGDTSGRTAGVQQQVISDLDELIRQAEKQCAQCQQAASSGAQGKQQSQRSQPKPGQQAEGGKQPGQQGPDANKPSASKPSQQGSQQSAAATGAGSADSTANRPPAELMKEVWGRLPQRMRERMLESSSDEFLPQYRDAIEKYFEKLAEEPDQPN